ncbi:imidazole glycerol phosphate synthase subunit HisH [Porticoccus sp. W117]|uniref:imidazole glycerol phosphate synthase subunit HisH n=1 Tax=Porticoccus sp. W117 TaxID=3054777 RepID=UPI002592CA98|nr:imidazole glycerol phosphate synthase subunit HisH [Porticoccus sp. W117]MDM3870404.1 imidazole glycerol phosphate synthase subunit HisH [Porticoccus sp. W117]
MNVVILDTGCANLASVRYAVERLGYQPVVSRDPDVVHAADKVLLPGVGTANEAMNNLKERQLPELINSLTQPVLGICLGMQLLASFSEEGQQACLGLVDAEVSKMETGELPLPHMGWNAVASEHPLFNGIKSGDYFYFVHSFALPVGDYTIATCDYGSPFTAAVQQGNFYGVQFHPERSGKAGAQLIQNFLTMSS